jgi:hypothetical protein
MVVRFHPTFPRWLLVIIRGRHGVFMCRSRVDLNQRKCRQLKKCAKRHRIQNTTVFRIDPHRVKPELAMKLSSRPDHARPLKTHCSRTPIRQNDGQTVTQRVPQYSGRATCGLSDGNRLHIPTPRPRRCAGELAAMRSGPVGRRRSGADVDAAPCPTANIRSAPYFPPSKTSVLAMPRWKVR